MKNKSAMLLWNVKLKKSTIVAVVMDRMKQYACVLLQSDGEELMQLESSPVSADPPSSDLDMEVILDEPPDTTPEFNFELSDITSYRWELTFRNIQCTYMKCEVGALIQNEDGKWLVDICAERFASSKQQYNWKY